MESCQHDSKQNAQVEQRCIRTRSVESGMFVLRCGAFDHEA